MIKYCFLVTVVLFLLAAVSASNRVLAQNGSAKQDDAPDVPFKESFQKNEQLIMPWANASCSLVLESEKEVNPPNCNELNLRAWLAASSLTLYNDDGTVWLNFSLDDNNPKHFLKIKDFLPFSTSFTDEGFTLRMIAESPDWYEVEVNDTTQATKFILKSDPLWTKITWNYFLATMRILSFDGENKLQLFDKPNGKIIEESSEIVGRELRFRLKIEGEWAFVEGYSHSKAYQGWVRWRKGREMLFESKFLFIQKFNKPSKNEASVFPGE